MHQVPGSTGTTHGISSHGLALGFPNGSFRTSAWGWRVRCTVAPAAPRRWNDVTVNKGGARQGWTRQIPYRLMIRSAEHRTRACVPVDIRPPACRRSPGRTKSMEAILRVAQLKDEPRQGRSAQQMPMRPGSGRLAKCVVCGCSTAPPDAAQHADYGPPARPQQIAHASRRCVRIRLVRSDPSRLDACGGHGAHPGPVAADGCG
ncbi:hypothetical protein GGR67_000653 [Xanthomonas arboricola]|nr:hypothetical protein [Xanthomonas euroxanthea]